MFYNITLLTFSLHLFTYIKYISFIVVIYNCMCWYCRQYWII